MTARWSTRRWVNGGLSPPATRWTGCSIRRASSLVEVPPDERRYLPDEAVAAVPFGTFQTLSAECGLDHRSVLRSAQRGQERVEGGGQVALVGGAHRRAQRGADERRRPAPGPPAAAAGRSAAARLRMSSPTRSGWSSASCSATTQPDECASTRARSIPRRRNRSAHSSTWSATTSARRVRGRSSRCG